MKVNIKLY